MKKGDIFYPVHYSKSDTSGEKAYEEFYTDGEIIDLKRMKSLGIVIDKTKPSKEKIQAIIRDLNAVFNKTETTKEEVISIIKRFLPNFEHIETGKSLDSKM